MQDKIIAQLDQQIGSLQRALAGLGPMRPGTLSRQYRRPADQEGGYWQLSYTYRQRSYTENVRPQELAQVRTELEEYRRFKELCAAWLELALQRARRHRQLTRRPPRQS